MGPRRLAVVGAAMVGLLALALLSSRVFQSRQPRELDSQSRLPRLWTAVEQLDGQEVDGVAFYAPHTRGRLDDLATPAEPILGHLPGVSSVDIGTRAAKPTCRIIHLRNWHFVPKDIYAADLRSSAHSPLADTEVERLHQELCLQVDAVQREQIALLSCLARHHGLRRVFSEGLTEKDLPDYRERIAVLRSMQKDQIPLLRKQLEEVRKLKKGMAASGREQSKGYQEAAAVESEIAGLLWEHHKGLLEVGAAGRLLIRGEIQEVLPLEDAELLEQARPITPDGKVQAVLQEEAAREDAIVKAATQGPFALIVLGAAHDLSGSVRRVAGGRCEYVRVTTSRVRQLADGGGK